jgi:acyl carrier protein
MNDIAPQAIDPRLGEILAIVARETGVDPAALRPEASIQDLGIASIDMVQALFALESHFDVEIPVQANSTGAEFGTVAELTGHVIATLDRARCAPGGTA